MVRVVKKVVKPASPKRTAAQKEPESAEDIIRQIEALKLQIAQAEALEAQKKQQQQQQQTPTPAQAPASNGDDDDQYEEFEEEYYEEVEEDASPPQSPEGRPRRPTPASPSKTGSPATKPAVHHERPVNAEPAEHHDAYRKEMDTLKEKFAFERPGWAAPAEVVNKDAPIDTDSLNNANLKKAQKEGYRRQVFEKDVEIVKGKFVKVEPVNLEPRLTWIVINVNKRKVGKIVMHLHGKDVSGIVDQFVELKGNSIERNNGMLCVVGQQPPLYITSAGPQGLDGKSGVYGVIQEGHDIFQSVMNSDPNAVLAVKQAHIYPVKMGKREFTNN